VTGTKAPPRALVHRGAPPWSCCCASPLHHTPRCDHWSFQRSCDLPTPHGTRFCDVIEWAVFHQVGSRFCGSLCAAHGDRLLPGAYLVPAVLWVQLHGGIPCDYVCLLMSWLCFASRWSGVPGFHVCGVLGGAAHVVRMLSGVVCEGVRLRMVLRSQQPRESWLWARVFRGFRFQASAVQGSMLGATTLRTGFTFQRPVGEIDFFRGPLAK